MKDAKAALEQMKKDFATAKKEIEAAGKDALTKVKGALETSTNGDIEAHLEEIKTTTQGKIDEVKKAMDEHKPPKDQKPEDKETKIDDKPHPKSDDKAKPEKLLMEWPEVLTNMADSEAV